MDLFRVSLGVRVANHQIALRDVSPFSDLLLDDFADAIVMPLEHAVHASGLPYGSGPVQAALPS